MYNGVPRNNFNQVSLRAAIGDFSAQEAIFKGTLKENITLGYSDITMNAIFLPYTPLGALFGFVPLPAGFVLLLLAITGAYLLASELVKGWFFRRFASLGLAVWLRGWDSEVGGRAP